MESDSDETIILDYFEMEDIMEVEEDNNDEPEPSDENVQELAPRGPGVLIAVELVLNDNEDNRSRSPLLPDSQNINGDQNALPAESSPVKDEEVSEGSGQKRAHSDDECEDDGKTCPICLDNWTNMGEHRICALKCGHLFGASCIVRWFSTQKKKSCPTCKKKAVKSDMRYIYAKKLIAMDASELESIKTQLDDVTREKNRIQIELTKAVCREHLIMQQVEDLKKKVQYLDSALEVKRQFSQSQASGSLNNATSDTVRLYMDKSLEICRDAGCRVLDHCSRYDLIIASTKSTNNLFSGYGIRKINISSYRPTAFIPLHAKPIRDVRFHPENPWVLSVSLDSTIKVVDMGSNNPISVFTSGSDPLWSCCWDAHNSFILYVGKQQGSIAKFDMRQMTQSVCTLDVPGDMSPVVSVACLAATPSGPVPPGGIISCKLNSLWVFENKSEEYVRHPLPMEGPFISMTYQNNQQHLLLSTRSSARVPYSRHHFCNIEKGSSDNLLCNTVHCYPGSTTQKLLSRSCILSNKNNYYVAAHEEANKTVSLWSVNTGRKAGSLPARDDVLDLCGVSNGSDNFLVALTERKLEFFKFT